MKKLPLILILLISVSSILNAQPQFKKNDALAKVNKELSIGDKVPDVTLVNMRNYTNTTAKLSDFKGKLVILDFWNKWCSSCISFFPKMEDFQKEFGNEIQILLVTNNTAKELAPLFEKSPNARNTNLPMIIGDTMLNSLFPHIGVPYHVWIDKDGIVKQTTNGESTTKGNIKAYLEGRSINLPIRRDRDISKLTLLDQMGDYTQKESLAYYSIITKKNKLSSEHFGGGFIDSTNKNIGNRYINFSITSLLSLCQPSYSKVVIETKDSSNLKKYFVPDNPDELSTWLENNSYCYEVRFPVGINGNSRVKFMQQDLERFFGVKSNVEERPFKTLVLYKTEDSPPKKHYNNRQVNDDVVCERTKDSIWVLKDCPVPAILNRIVGMYSGQMYSKDEIPKIDETHLSGRITAELKVGKTLAELNLELQKIGLIVKEETRNIQCLIIKELN